MSFCFCRFRIQSLGAMTHISSRTCIKDVHWDSTHLNVFGNGGLAFHWAHSHGKLALAVSRILQFPSGPVQTQHDSMNVTLQDSQAILETDCCGICTLPQWSLVHIGQVQNTFEGILADGDISSLIVSHLPCWQEILWITKYCLSKFLLL